VRATLDRGGDSGSFDYAIPFTTEGAAATNRPRTETLEVSGMRLVEGAWYGQIVGATTNKDDAFPEPGAAVYTVLSGRASTGCPDVRSRCAGVSGVPGSRSPSRASA
jgi:hypothetical protein